MNPSDVSGVADLAARARKHEDALISALEALKRHETALAGQRAKNAEAAETIARLVQTVNALVAIAPRTLAPYVAGGAVLPSPGTLADFRDDAYLRDNPYYTEPDVFERVARDTLALPPHENNEGYAASDDLLNYWLWGLNNYRKVVTTARAHDVVVRRVFDFGGSTGRLARHFAVQDEPREVWWSDFKVASVQWALANLPRDMHVFLNTTIPALPIADGYFDLVTAFSVFTHIDDLEIAWLLELKRITRPGGMLYLTIHDEASWAVVADDNALGVAIRKAPNGRDLVFDGTLPAERLAFAFTNESHYNTNTFHSQEYIRRTWGRFFDIVEIIPNEHNYQAVVVAINRPS